MLVLFFLMYEFNFGIQYLKYAQNEAKLMIPGSSGVKILFWLIDVSMSDALVQ